MYIIDRLARILGWLAILLIIAAVCAMNSTGGDKLNLFLALYVCIGAGMATFGWLVVKAFGALIRPPDYYEDRNEHI